MVGEEKRVVTDEQTGKEFEVVPETLPAWFLANFSFLYLGFALAFFLWLLFDTWARKNTLVHWFGYSSEQVPSLSTPIFRSFAYAFIGGALGGTIAGYRSCIFWHSEQRAFGAQFIWRYLFFPWLGATLALFVYAILGGGVAIIGGNINVGATNMLLALAIGSLVGYGSPQVVKWLDDQVNKLFKIVPAQVQVPDLIGMIQQDAERKLSAAGLKSEVSKKQQAGKETGKVFEQEPRAGSMAPRGELVKVTIAE